MNREGKIPVLREEDGELLGFVSRDISGWSALTVFGYRMARTEDRAAAETVVRSEGLLVLKGMWRYFDEHDKDWYPCVLKEVFENRVVVIRTNEMGFQDTSHYKMVTLRNPSETMLVKA